MATPFPFGSGNTLLASQLNAITTLPVSTKTASYVLTVADLGTRVVMNSASATTITVNTSIFAASDVVEIANIGAGVCTITAGTCTVGTTGTLALAQNATGKLIFISASAAIYFAGGVTASSSGLNLIAAQTIGSAVSSVTVSSAFSSTYENYFITVSGGVTSATCRFLLTLGSTATGYYWAGQAVSYAGSASVVNGSNVASFGYTGGGNTSNISSNFYLYSPNLAKNTFYSTMSTGIATGDSSIPQGGFLNDTTQYTAFTLAPNTGTITGGTIRVYGLLNS